MRRAHIHRTHRLGRAVCIVSAAVAFAVPYLAAAQQATTPAPSAGSREIPRPEELEPGVNTTPAAPAAAASAAPAQAAPPAATPAAAPAARSPAAATTAAPKPTAAREGAPAAKNVRKGPDRMELDPTDITGNRELPKVLYIVPWKRSDLGDVVGRPVNSLLDEVLQPLDRDVFQRENRYYDALKPGGGDAKGGAAQGSQTKP
jgi:hypothetical protein